MWAKLKRGTPSPSLLRGAKGATAEAKRIAGRWRIVLELTPEQVKLVLGR